MAAFRGGHSCLIAAMRILASFEWSFIWDNRDQLWEGFKDTIKTAAIGVAGSFLIGLVLGAVRAHRIPVLNQIAWAYVEAIRNTPILVQIFLLYYGTPELGRSSRAGRVGLPPPD